NFLSKYEMLAAVFVSDDHEATTALSLPSIDNTANEPADDMGTDDISPEFFTVTLAELYMRQGHSDQAREVLKTILAKNPDNEQAAIKLTALDGTLTKAECNVDYNPVLSDGTDLDTALIGELEGWLARLARLRSLAL
ncbi:MAG: tetratricopeptide repeat protein, partial [Syntrophaceae bacterium]|nr:tetratricopeptide repeat protein [Syntrophaceae bacterium]